MAWTSCTQERLWILNKGPLVNLPSMGDSEQILNATHWRPLDECCDLDIASGCWEERNTVSSIHYSVLPLPLSLHRLTLAEHVRGKLSSTAPRYQVRWDMQRATVSRQFFPIEYAPAYTGPLQLNHYLIRNPARITSFT
jgi:hypothetical protein